MSLVLFFLSCLVLTLEVLETKIFAYSLASNLIFVVVGVALLGFGAGGTALSLVRRLGDPRRLVRWSLFSMALLIVLAHVGFAVYSPHLEFRFDPLTIGVLLGLASPYFMAGLAIAAILAEPAGNVNRRYGINLLGSGLGCGVVFVILGPLTAPQCLVLCATGAGLLGAFSGQPRRGPAISVLAAGVVLFFYAGAVFPYQPEPARDGGQLSLLKENLEKAFAIEKSKPGGAHLQRVSLDQRFDRWDPTARIQVHDPVIESTDPGYLPRLERVHGMWFTQDSSYGSPLVGKGAVGLYERTCYGLGFFRRRPNEDVLIIGLGGAPDVQTALHYAPRSVTGVDINATAVAMVRGPMKDFLGDPYGDARVHVVVRDGRSFVRGSQQRYDHIQLSGVDTKSVLAAGTLALNESYLYTLDAFVEYLDHLKPEGVLCILYAGDDLMHRLAVSAMTALSEIGATSPHRHLMLLRQSQIFAVLVKKTPFTAIECAQMDHWLAACTKQDGTTGVVLLVYELLIPGGALSLAKPPRALFIPDGRPTEDPVMAAARAGRLAQYLQGQRQARGIDLAPVPDSRPFFFQLETNDRVWQQPPEYFARLFRLAGIMGGLALLLILGPLLVFGLRGMAVLKALPFALYFAALGAGFILAEIGLIQRYVLFLGHQAYAFPVVIGGLLVAAGLGSLWSARMAARPAVLIGAAVATACLAIAGHQLGLSWLLGVTADLPLSLRLGIGTLVLLPLGVPLGMLFPSGLRSVKKLAPALVPWAIGINGVFSVLGSTLVLPGAILYGFPVMALLAAGIYVLAALVAVAALRRLA